MIRPEIRIIDNQQTSTTSVEVSGYEAENLLAKYGYKTNNHPNLTPVNPSQNLTFEEMVRKQEDEQRRIEEDRMRRLSGPKAVTFDDNRVGYSETKWSSMDINGNNLGIKVQIVTDMKF